MQPLFVANEYLLWMIFIGMFRRKKSKLQILVYNFERALQGCGNIEVFMQFQRGHFPRNIINSSIVTITKYL